MATVVYATRAVVEGRATIYSPDAEAGPSRPASRADVVELVDTQDLKS